MQLAQIREAKRPGGHLPAREIVQYRRSPFVRHMGQFYARRARQQHADEMWNAAGTGRPVAAQLLIALNERHILGHRLRRHVVRHREADLKTTDVRHRREIRKWVVAQALVRMRKDADERDRRQQQRLPVGRSSLQRFG